MTRTDATMTVPEAARRLGMPGGDVYRLLFRGELDGGPGRDGAVQLTAVSVERYLAEHETRDDRQGDTSRPDDH